MPSTSGSAAQLDEADEQTISIDKTIVENIADQIREGILEDIENAVGAHVAAGHRLRRAVVAATLVGSLVLLVACPTAADLSSSSYTSRGGHVSAAAKANLSSSSFAGAGALGQSEAIGLSGGATDLTTVAPGFFQKA